ncbi:fibroblast growth factor receptor 2 isoform X1 [Lates japonicus]|uniref:Fibroblast growth factor receptor 2 isoform X1 n=1 Tax=Lates japonicus TaxID=270547 RepID=A0AAD3MMK6_LATJO|nr:fibroblast growth factor receptor 2 isoform X1 [Lates japonicus]
MEKAACELLADQVRCAAGGNPAQARWLKTSRPFHKEDRMGGCMYRLDPDLMGGVVPVGQGNATPVTDPHRLFSRTVSQLFHCTHVWEGRRLGHLQVPGGWPHTSSEAAEHTSLRAACFGPDGHPPIEC